MQTTEENTNPVTGSKPRPRLLTLRYAEITEAVAMAHILCVGEIENAVQKEDTLRALDDALKDITEWREHVAAGRYDSFANIPESEMLSLLCPPRTCTMQEYIDPATGFVDAVIMRDETGAVSCTQGNADAIAGMLGA